MRAFHGDPAVKRVFEAALTDAIEADRFLPPQPGVPEGYSAMFAIAGTSDPRAFETATGVPGGLGLLLDRLVSGLGDDRAEARQYAQSWLSVLPVGACLGSSVSALAIWMLDRAPDTPWAMAVRALHEEVLGGTVPERARWAAARSSAAAGDGVSPVAATLAWSPASSRTILTDGLSVLQAHVAQQAGERTGWTETDRVRADQVMQRIWEETTDERETTPESYNFQAVFHAREPDLAARFEAALACQEAAYSATCRACADACLTILSDASRLADAS